MKHIKNIIIGLFVGGVVITSVMYCDGMEPAGDSNGSICPRCKSDSIATIMYGLLSEKERENPDSFQEVMRKRRMVGGGCLVSPEKYSCYSCGYRW